MKFRFAVFALLLTLAAVASAQQLSTLYKNIDASWNAPTGGTIQTACPATAPAAGFSSCVKTYIETLTDPTGGINTVKAAWGATTAHFGPGGFLMCGNWNVSLVIDYFDEKGVEQTTAPLTGIATVAGCPFVVSPPSGPLQLKVS